MIKVIQLNSLNLLLEKCKKNDAVAQKAIYDMYAPKMLGVCIRYIVDRSESEHVMIGGFAKMLDKIHQFKGEGSFEGWVRKIIINECLTYLKRNHIKFETSATYEREQLHLASETIESPIFLEELIQLIQRMPNGYKTIFNLYVVEGYKHKEIAEMMKININTSKSQLNRARVWLQERIKDFNSKNIQNGRKGIG